MKRTGLLAILLILPLMACYGDNYGHMGGMDHMMNYGYGYGYGGPLMWFFLILLICIVVYLVVKKKKP